MTHDRALRRTLGGIGAAVLAALALGPAVAGCAGDDDAANVPRAPLVATARVEGVALEDRIEATGELRAQERAEIAAEVDGRVTEQLADEGEAVTAGQALLLIDPERRELEVDDARAGLAQARAALAEARRNFERVKQLHQRGAASDARLDDIRTALSQAESQVSATTARLGVAERALRDATVRAPFSGLLASRSVSRGEYVRPGTPLFELVALDPVEVEFHLPERDSARVAMDQSVAVRVAPYPDEAFAGRVTFVAPTIEPSTRTLRVKAEIDNRDGRLRPGTFARVDLGVARRADVPMVPEEAVLQRADGQVVFRLAGDERVERRVVRTGTHRDGRIEVVEGLSVGDAVVTRGHTALVDGARVRVEGSVGPEGAASPVAEVPAVGEGS